MRLGNKATVNFQLVHSYRPRTKIDGIASRKSSNPPPPPPPPTHTHTPHPFRWPDSSLASQTHFRKRGKGLVNCVYKPCPTALYSAVQSCCSILSHDTLHHCLSSNSSLENSEREQGHLSHYYSNRKTLRE